MEKMEDNKITIIDSDGNEHLMEILFTYENEHRNKKYVFFYEPGNEEEIIVRIYNDEGELFEIDDDEEYGEVEEVFNAFNEEAN